ncbi:oocyte-expressed protein homolog [Apodemus sylvaticus]|uniref:oocyte-expressed protein homolog n=1 Tax=Apodemus sylvaticus TaxID=10129 RepID=UPI0022448D9F|nr:oocyte-expressed protein homolog [Apodemus sylvaticus]
MGSHTAEAHDKPDPCSQKLLNVPPVSLRLLVRPWWLPVQELSNPLVLYMEDWMAKMIIGQDQAEISEIEWMTQTLLRVDYSGKLAEITIFGRPRAQTRMKNILLNMAAWHKDDETRLARKIAQVKKYLKAQMSSAFNSRIERLKLAAGLLPLE